MISLKSLLFLPLARLCTLTLDCEAHARYAVRLPGAHAAQRVLPADDDRVRLDVLDRAPGEGQLRQLVRARGAPRDRAPALSFGRSCQRHFWVSDRRVRGSTSRSGKRRIGIFLCAHDGPVHTYIRGQHRATS